MTARNYLSIRQLMDIKTDKPSTSDAQMDTAQLKAVRNMLEGRFLVMREALREPKFADHLETHRYLDEGTPERAYWHAGYVSALACALNFIECGITEYPMEDIDGGYVAKIT
jgi:hypothetical protein